MPVNRTAGELSTILCFIHLVFVSWSSSDVRFEISDGAEVS